MAQCTKRHEPLYLNVDVPTLQKYLAKNKYIFLSTPSSGDFAPEKYFIHSYTVWNEGGTSIIALHLEHPEAGEMFIDTPTQLAWVKIRVV